MADAKPSLFITVRRQGSGKRELYAFMIAGKNFRIKSNPTASTYQLCSVDQKLKSKVFCDGLPKPPRVILKIFCQVPQQELKRHREERLYNRLLEGKPPTPV